MPATAPIIIPPAMAIAFALLVLHVPPGTALLRVMDVVAQTAAGPVIVPASGCGFTVNDRTDWQPVGSVYIITVVPAFKPATMPVADPTDATEVLLLLHVPPAGSPLSVADNPAHTLLLPVTGSGNGFTVTTFVVTAVLHILVTA